MSDARNPILSSFAGIAIGLVSLGEPFRIPSPEELLPAGTKMCTKCGEVKLVDDFHRKHKDGGDGAENRVTGCKKCKNAQNAERHRRRKAAKRKGEE